uniref:Protein kinase domain-containing protein n=1 Tax=Leersia perrieri TaxID=77586 RepID=A0A0D9VIX1_9ORYZ
MPSQLVVSLLLMQLTATVFAKAASAAKITLHEQVRRRGRPLPVRHLLRLPHRHGFLVTCDRTYQPPKLFLERHGPEVLEISLRNSTVRVRGAVWSFAAGSNASDDVTVNVLAGVAANLSLQPYVLSASRNGLVVVGCGFRAVATPTPSQQQAIGGATFASCAPTCPIEQSQKLDGRCDGVGCYEARIPVGLTSFGVQFSWHDQNSTTPPWVAPGASVLVVEREWWRDRQNVFEIKKPLFSSGHVDVALVIPTVLDWTLGQSSCTDQSFHSGCVSKNSECVNSTSAYGYVCRCSGGYDGNPYMIGGCQDQRKHFPAGNFYQSLHKAYERVLLAMGIGIGICFLLLVLAVVFAIKVLKIRKDQKMKEYFFKQNRGLLLQQLIDKDIAERMIFSLEELKKATNKFDKARVLGGGGHGMVYKGILSDQHVVAIKKSRVVIQKEIDEFINEVAILSQINHRNVVKLFGCCLETEVPLLVYEFIPNGTLYAHLHVDSSQQSLPWKDRLRIACEVASALAYLHSAASTSIVHRDIKTSNILLDDRLTAKVSDFGASRGIAIEQSGVTTGIQGTHGYMDPEYCYTRRLTDRSDVYSFGVMLVEMLTRKKPSKYISSKGISLVAQFTMLLNKNKLSDILDEQVVEEGRDEAQQVAVIAAMCLRLRGDCRPAMRNVEMRLRGLQDSAHSLQISLDMEEQLSRQNGPTFEEINGDASDNCSRKYSLEAEIVLSASLER